MTHAHFESIKSRPYKTAQTKSGLENKRPFGSLKSEIRTEAEKAYDV
jgi:hypothetical protein